MTFAWIPILGRPFDNRNYNTVYHGCPTATPWNWLINYAAILKVAFRSEISRDRPCTTLMGGIAILQNRSQYKINRNRHLNLSYRFSNSSLESRYLFLQGVFYCPLTVPSCNSVSEIDIWVKAQRQTNRRSMSISNSKIMTDHYRIKPTSQCVRECIREWNMPANMRSSNFRTFSPAQLQFSEAPIVLFPRIIIV